MCDLCSAHDFTIAQFRRAMAQGLDPLTLTRLSKALADFEANRPKCSDAIVDGDPAQKVIDLRVHKIGKVLNTITPPELQILVSGIEKHI